MADLTVNSRLTIPDQELNITTARSSGPGGQNVNKVNTKVTLKWSPEQCQRLDPHWRRRLIGRNRNRINREGELILQSDRYRNYGRNLADVRQKLVALLIETQSPPRKRKPTKPTRGSQRRRLKQKRQRSEKKQRRSTPSWDD